MKKSLFDLERPKEKKKNKYKSQELLTDFELKGSKKRYS